MTKCIEYGIRGKSSKAIEYGIRGKGKSVEYAKIKIPSSDFDRRKEMGHSPEVNPES